MNQEPKTAKKPKMKSRVQVRDLKPKKDAKGGDIMGSCAGGTIISRPTL